MELLQAIALLCQLSGADAIPTHLDKYQLECQKYYIKCLKNDQLNASYKTLAKCVEERKP